MTPALHSQINLLKAVAQTALFVMRHPLTFLLSCLLLCTPCFAQRSPRRPQYVTQMGRRVLAMCEIVAVGKIASVNPPFRGVSTARLELTEKLSGFTRGDSVTIIYVEDYLAPDVLRATFESSTVSFRPKRSASADRVMEKSNSATGNQADARIETKGGTKAPGGSAAARGVKLLKGETGIYFLQKKGASYALIGLVRERDPLFLRKKKRLEDMIAIERVATKDGRFRAAKAFFLRGLAASDLWERGNAAREIEWLARHQGGAFTSSDRKFLSERLYLEKNETIASALERAVRGLSPGAELNYAVEAEERERARYVKVLEREEKIIARNTVAELRAADLVGLANRYGRAATQTLCTYLNDPDAVVRESVAGSLSRHGGPSCRAPLRAALQIEKDVDAARAMIHTLGVKSDPKSVAILAERLATGDLERTAAQALARVGTDEAWSALLAYRPKASRAAKGHIDSLRRERAKAR
jgi:hypothetical protein